MKRLYDFCFCPTSFSAEVVWYFSRVGVSAVDQRAHASLKRIAAASPCFLYAPHDRKMVELLESLAASMVHRRPHVSECYSLLVRQQFVDVLWLARFLKKNPPALLNSPAIVTPFDANFVELSHMATRAAIVQRRSRACQKLVSQSTHVKNLSNHGKEFQQ